jgi:hypothetical protein
MDQGYTVFRWRPAEAKLLSALKSFRIEWGEEELIYEEGCISLTTQKLEESLGIAEKWRRSSDYGYPRHLYPDNWKYTSGET